jgi:heme exporter protein D
MIWRSAGEFFAMGGYGLYVWGSLAMCALALAVEMLLVSRRRHAALLRLRRRARADATEWESS